MQSGGDEGLMPDEDIYVSSKMKNFQDRSLRMAALIGGPDIPLAQIGHGSHSVEGVFSFSQAAVFTGSSLEKQEECRMKVECFVCGDG